MRGGEGLDPSTGRVNRSDDGLKRLIRGFMADRWYVNTSNIVYMLSALSRVGMGVTRQWKTWLAVRCRRHNYVHMLFASSWKLQVERDESDHYRNLVYWRRCH